MIPGSAVVVDCKKSVIIFERKLCCHVFVVVVFIVVVRLRGIHDC